MANASPRLKKKRAPPPIPMKREPSPPSPADTSPADGSPTEQIADDDNDVLSPMSVLSPEDESTEDENENDFSEEEQTKPEEEEQTEPEEEEQIEPEEEEPPKPKLTDRERVLQEMVHTEDQYVKSLKTLVNDYQKPLKEACAQGKPIVSMKNLLIIFGDIELLMTFNEKLLSELRVTTADKVGKLFCDFAPFLKMYTTFVDFADQSMKLVREEMQRERNVMDKFMQKANRDGTPTPTLKEFCATKRETLDSLLIKPVQRVPRYRLLLEEFLKKTDDDAPDRESIEQALAKVRTAATHCNEQLRHRQKEQEMLQMHMRFKDNKMLPWDSDSLKKRKIIKEGIVRKVDRKGLWRSNVMLLFNDYVAYGKGSFGGEVQFSQVLDLSAVLAEPLEVFLDEKNVFQLSAPKKSFVLHSDERDEWTACIRKAIAARRKLLKMSKEPSFQVAPVWAPDTKACSQCGKAFSLFKGVSRHHCRRCGKCVCQECSAGRWKFPFIDKEKLLRMCNVCFDDVVTAINGSLVPEPPSDRLLGLDPAAGDAVSVKVERAWYPAEVSSANDDGTYQILYKSKKLRKQSKGNEPQTHPRCDIRTATDLEVQRHLFRREAQANNTDPQANASLGPGSPKPPSTAGDTNDASKGSTSKSPPLPVRNRVRPPKPSPITDDPSPLETHKAAGDTNADGDVTRHVASSTGHQRKASLPMSPVKSNNIKAGTLFKKGMRSMMWTPRYCVLTPSALKYSHAVRRAKEGTLQFDIITSVQMGKFSKHSYKDASGRVKVFSISATNEKHDHLFKCEDGAEAAQWVKAINVTLKEYKETQDALNAAKPKPVEFDFSEPGETDSHEPEARDPAPSSPYAAAPAEVPPPPPARGNSPKLASPTTASPRVPPKVPEPSSRKKAPAAPARVKLLLPQVPKVPKLPSRKKGRKPAAPSRKKNKPAAPARDKPKPAAPTRDKPKPAAPARDKPKPAAPARDKPKPAAPARKKPKVPKVPKMTKRKKGPKPTAPTRDKPPKPAAPTRDKPKPTAPTRKKPKVPKVPKMTKRKKGRKPAAPTRDKTPTKKKRRPKKKKSASAKGPEDEAARPPRPMSMKPTLAHHADLGAEPAAASSDAPPPLPTEPASDWIVENDLDEFRHVLDELGADRENDLRTITLDDLQDPELSMLETDVTRLWNKIMMIRAQENESAPALPSEGPPPIPSEAPPPLPSEAPPPIPSEPLPSWD